MQKSVDDRLTTPYHKGGYSVEKKCSLLRELRELEARAIAAMEEDFSRLELENSLMQDQNEQLARDLYTEIQINERIRGGNANG